MAAMSRHLSPVQQAEQALQVVRVLTRMEARFETGHWEQGRRYGPSGGNCLIGAIDEASGWTQPGVAREATRQLASRLPRALRPLARVRPRMALAMYNDVVGRDGAWRLVRRTRFELGGRGPATGSPATTRPRVTVAWSSDGDTGTGAVCQPAPRLPATPGHAPDAAVLN